MSDLIPVREAEEFKPAWERLKAIKDERQREHALKRFAKLCDFQQSEELFGRVPLELKADDHSTIVPQDAVFLLNWITVYPGNPIPPPGERDIVRNQLWDVVEEKLGYARPTA